MSRSIGNIQANGGFENGYNYQSASLAFVVIGGVTGGAGAGVLGHVAQLAGGYEVADGGLSGGHFLEQGKAVPNSAAEYLYEVVSRKATVIGGQVFADGTMHLIVENNVQGWLVNSSNDATDAEHPGIVPKPEAVPGEVVPGLRKMIRKLGTIDLNDGDLATGQSTYDFSAATVHSGDVAKFDVTLLTEDVTV